MGPMATVFFYKKLLELTPAKKDQDHIETVIYSNTKIADRTQCISKKNFDSIVLDLIKSAKLLEKCGIDIIVMPCNTAHYFAKDIQKSISIPFINMISETVKYLISFKGIKKIGVL
jgi:aspartate racemase